MRKTVSCRLISKNFEHIWGKPFQKSKFDIALTEKKHKPKQKQNKQTKYIN